MGVAVGMLCQQYHHKVLLFLSYQENRKVGTSLVVCCRQKPILTPCWNCFFDLLFAAFVIIIIQNVLPQRILPLCLTIKPKCLCSEPCPPTDDRKEEINTSLIWGLPFYEIFARLMAFLFCFHFPSSLIYKRTWHQDPSKMVILWLQSAIS